MKLMKCMGNSVSISLDEGPAGWLGIWMIRSTCDFELEVKIRTWWSEDIAVGGHSGRRT